MNIVKKKIYIYISKHILKKKMGRKNPILYYYIIKLSDTINIILCKYF